MVVKKKEKKDQRPLRKGRVMGGDDSKKSKRIRHPNKFS